jgi:hypothetical protein
MAVNLTPKADATLVAQSYRMGMAGVPQDLSKTFDGISKSYGEAMTEVGKAGAIVGEQVGQLAGQGLKIAAQAIKDLSTGTSELSDTYSLDTRQGIVDNLQKIKKGNNLFVRDEDGKMKFNDRYIPFSKKGKEAREEFRRNKNVAIKDLKAMQEGTFMNATAIEQNAIIQDGSSQQEWVMNNAIASKGYGLKEGQYAGISAKSFYKDVDGEQRQHFMLVKDGKEVMIDDSGAIVEVTEGQEGVHTAATDIGSLIKKKDDKVAPGLIKIQESVYSNASKGKDFQANVTKSAILSNIKTNDQAATAFHSNELGFDISYAQSLEGENEITGEMFVSLLDVNKDGKVDASETSFAGLEGDFSTAENMIKLKKAMLDPNNSKSRDIFANWATSELTKKHTEGNQFFVENKNNDPGEKTTQKERDRIMTLNNLASGNEKVYYSNTMTLMKDPSSTDDSSTWKYALVPNTTLSNPKYDLNSLPKDKFYPVEHWYNNKGGNASPGMFGASTQTPSPETPTPIPTQAFDALGVKDGVYANQRSNILGVKQHSGYLFDYKNEGFIVGTLSRAYGSMGYRFEKAGKNKIVVTSKGGNSSVFKTNGTGVENGKSEQALKAWMIKNKPQL